MTDTDSQPPILTILDESGEVLSSVTLCKATFHIGRGEENDIILPFKWVSRQHAMLQTEKSGALNLIDLGSTNGTFVNDRRIITPTLLCSGNRLAIGRTIMVFHQETRAGKTLPEREESDVELTTVSYSRKELVTILVSDIHGFTGLAESLGDQRVSELLQAWSPRVSAIIRTHDGMVDKFLGDAVMAVWIGGDVVRNVRQALAAALAIEHFTHDLGMKMTGIGRRITTGGAINTGEAFAGNMGSDGRQDFTVIGDVVNVTFRLEGLTALTGMDILLGEGSAVHVHGEDLPLRHSRHLLKGKDDEIAAYGCSFADLAQWLEAT